MEILEITADRYTDIHGERQYGERYLVMDEDGGMVVGVGESVEAAMADAARCCAGAGFAEPERVYVWDQEVKVEIDGRMVDFDAAVNLMDAEIVAILHSTIAPCTNQQFSDAYAKAHEEKYGEDFIVI